MIANPHDARVTHDRPLPGCAGVVCGRVCGRVCGAEGAADRGPFEAFAAIALVRRFERLAQPECVARSNRIYLSLCGLARLHLMHTLHVERWHVHIWLHSNWHSTLLCCSLGRTCSVRCDPHGDGTSPSSVVHHLPIALALQGCEAHGQVRP